MFCAWARSERQSTGCSPSHLDVCPNPQNLEICYDKRSRNRALEIVTLLDGPGGPNLVSRILANCSDICFPSEAETSLQYAEGDTVFAFDDGRKGFSDINTTNF